MKYNTFFNIGDEVWFMFNNKARFEKIDSIRYCKFVSPVIVSDIIEREYYCVKGINHSFEPKDLYRSKEELIDSLR